MARYDLQRITTEDPANPDGTTQVTLTRQQLVAQLDSGALTRAKVSVNSQEYRLRFGKPECSLVVPFQ